MRLRMPVLAAALVACAPAVAAPIASAHPHSNRALTIHATPSHTFAGERVLIFGRLEGRHSAHQKIVLWHRINPASHFTVISRTTTDADGRYEFVRAAGVVKSNRNWFVRGPVFTHSQTIHERVAAELSINPSATEGTTRHALTFTGHVYPVHAGSAVDLQVQRGAGNDWTTIERGRVGAGSDYAISYRWRRPVAPNVRVYFAGDDRNTPAASDPVSVVINQRQSPYFTISSSSAIVPNGSQATISGTLYQQHSSTPQGGSEVALFSRTPQSGAYAYVTTTTTGSDGTYSFSVQNTTNKIYQARTIMSSPTRYSAQLFQGVQDTVTMSANTSSASTTSPVTFSGTVTPSKAGHVVYLEKLGSDGRWHVVATSTISPTSTFTFSYAFGYPGAKQIRARVVGGPINVGGISGTVPVTVTLPPLSMLPTS